MWVTASLAIAALALLAHGWLLGYFAHFGLFGNGVDAVVYRHGGGTILEGKSLYSFTLFETDLPFTYPPFAAIVFVVLALMPVATSIVAVDAANIALLFMAVTSSWRLLGYRGVNTQIVSVCMAVALTWLEPVRMTLWLGQINLLLLVLVLWDLGRPEGSRTRGIATGVAAGLKLTPAFFVLYVVALRQWRTAVVAAITFVVTVLAGFALVLDDAWSFWTSALFHSDRIGLLQSPANQSIRGALARAWPDGSPPFVMWGVCAALVGALGLWAAVVAHRRGELLLSLTLCGSTTPMVSPFSWGHHWVWCVPLSVLVLHHACRAAQMWRWIVAFVSILPFVAWYWTTPDGVAVIGIFMFGEPGLVGFLGRNAYVLAFTVCLAGVWAYSVRDSIGRNHAPRPQLLLEVHRRVRRTGGRKANERRGNVDVQRNHVTPEGGFSLRAVEEDSFDAGMIAEERAEIIDDDGGFDDGGIQTSVTRAQFQHVPHGDAVA